MAESILFGCVGRLPKRMGDRNDTTIRKGLNHTGLDFPYTLHASQEFTLS